MKGLMKNIRYIFHIFEEEEEEENEIQIGLPTDVKHVAHIGWDGPSVNSPSWMNEFKSSAPGNASSTIPNGDVDEVDWGSQDSTTKISVKESPGRDLPNLPKSSRRQPSVDSIGSIDSPHGSPTQKTTKSSKRRSKKKESNNNSPRESEPSDSCSLPNIPKKSRRKNKSKDNGDGSVKSTSSKSREKGLRHGSRHGSMHGSDDGSISKQYSDEVSNLDTVSLKDEEFN